MSRLSDYVKARRRAPAARMNMAAGGMYELGSDEAGDLRFNAGGRKRSVFDLMPTNPAISPRVRNVHIPFQTAYDVHATVWDESSQNAGTPLAIQDSIGNKAKFTNDTGDNDYYYYEYVYEMAQLQSGKDLWFYVSVEIGDVDEADMFVGLCADLASGDLFDNRVDCIGFTLADGSAVLNAVCTKDGTGSPAAGDPTLSLTDATEVWLGFHSNGTSYVDFFAGAKGSEVERWRVTTNLPDDEILAPAFGLRNGKGAANSMTISDIHLLIDR